MSSEATAHGHWRAGFLLNLVFVLTEVTKFLCTECSYLELCVQSDHIIKTVSFLLKSKDVQWSSGPVFNRKLYFIAMDL